MGSVLLGLGCRLGLQCLPTLQGEPRLGHRWPCVSRPHLQPYAAVPRRQRQQLAKRTHATAAGISDVATGRSHTHKLAAVLRAQACAVSPSCCSRFLRGCSEPGMGLSEELKLAIDKYVSDNKVVLFMKGNRQFPQCGFSNTCVQARLPLYRCLPAHHQLRLSA